MDLKWCHLLFAGLVVLAAAGAHSREVENHDGPDQDKTGSCYRMEESLKCFTMHKEIEELEEQLDELNEQVPSGEQTQQLKQELEDKKQEWEEYSSRIMDRCLKWVNIIRLRRYFTDTIEELWLAVTSQLAKSKTRRSSVETPEKLKEYFSLSESENELFAQMMREEHAKLFQEAIESKQLDSKDIEWDCASFVDTYKAQMMMANRWSRVQSMTPEKVDEVTKRADADLYAFGVYAKFCLALLSSEAQPS